MAVEHALLTWAHLVAASVWVGGGLFLGMVMAPVLKRTSMTPAERLGLMVAVGRRFNLAAVPALAVLVGTGLYVSHPLLARPGLLLESSYGTFLAIKIVLVAAVIVAFAAHVRLIRGSVEEDVASGRVPEEGLRRLRRRVIILGELTMALSVAILLMAALMDAGV